MKRLTTGSSAAPHDEALPINVLTHFLDSAFDFSLRTKPLGIVC